MIENMSYSRPRATAERLGDLAEDCHRFLDKRILLTGETPVLATANGRECLLSSLRLLIRICPNVAVALPPGSAGLLEECRITSNRLAFGAPVQFLTEPIDLTGFDAILCIGTTARPELPWTVINSHGWQARVSSISRTLTAECGQANPIGALAAACLGVSEVFKRLLRLKAERGKLLDGLSFSLYNYDTHETDCGPALPDKLIADLLIVGAGAIGNGIIYLLSTLPLSGNIWIVDAQGFRHENLGTCLLVGPSDMGKDKAIFAAEFLGARLKARGFREDLASFKQRLGRELPVPQLVLCGLDNIDARHEVQNLWPDLIIDGAISDFGSQVSRHPWNENTACLMCLFRHPIGESAVSLASRATGLSLLRSQQGLSIITEQDVLTAPVDKQDYLRTRIGQQICSVVQEAVVQQISEDKQRKGFEPSVPFVACLSACMVVGELIKSISSELTTIEPRYQMDILCGPVHGQHLPQERRKDCVCVTRRHNIEAVRQFWIKQSEVA